MLRLGGEMRQTLHHDDDCNTEIYNVEYVNGVAGIPRGLLTNLLPVRALLALEVGQNDFVPHHP